MFKMKKQIKEFGVMVRDLKELMGCGMKITKLSNPKMFYSSLAVSFINLLLSVLFFIKFKK